MLIMVETVYGSYENFYYLGNFSINLKFKKSLLKAEGNIVTGSGFHHFSCIFLGAESGRYDV